MYSCHEYFAKVRGRKYNGGNFGFCLRCSLGQQFIAVVGQGFFMFLMIWYRGYARASKMRVRLLSSVVFWDDHVASKWLGINNRFFTAEWMMRVECEKVSCSRLFFLEFSGFKTLNFYVWERDSLFGVGECVFNTRADCIRECHQGFELEVGVKENEENVINGTFPKED